MLKPLKKIRLYEQIIIQFKEEIKKGVIKPGDKLPTERELALQLNVSRTAIREALRSMELLGFLESRVGAGTFIKEITIINVIDPFSLILSQNKKLIKELIEVRIILESEIAKLAARKIDDLKITNIAKTIDEMEREISKSNIGLKEDNEFHNSIANAAGNLAMGAIMNLCSKLLSETRKATLEISGQPKKTLIDHKKIFDAIKAGDEESAAKYMKEHLIKAIENLEKNKM